MANESGAGDPPSQVVSSEKGLVGWIGVNSLGLYFVALTIVLVQSLSAVWPEQITTTSVPVPTIEAYPVFGLLPVRLTREVQLMWVAALMGAIGAQVHCVTSFLAYAGSNQLRWSWAWWYFLRPFIGVSMALLIYFAVRGGMLNGQGGGEVVNPYGIAAFSGLVGMFSRQATEKLLVVLCVFLGVEPEKRELADPLTLDG